MLLALVATDEAGLGAGLDDVPRQLWLKCRLARQHLASRRAKIGAVEIESNTTHKLVDRLFAEARVGTTRAGRRAPEALGNTAPECVAVHVRRLRMGPDHS
jgi:hypothetical protein